MRISLSLETGKEWYKFWYKKFYFVTGVLDVLFILFVYWKKIYCPYYTRLFPIHSHSGKKNANTLPRVGKNWKILPPQQFAPLGPQGANCLRGRIFQYIPPLNSVLLQCFVIVQKNQHAQNHAIQKGSSC